jgi:hypothetical protein
MNKKLFGCVALLMVLAMPVLTFADFDSDNIVSNTITEVTDFLVQITLGLAVLAYVGAGLLHLTAMGDASKINNARTVVLYTTIGVVIILMARGFLSIVKGFVK